MLKQNHGRAFEEETRGLTLHDELHVTFLVAALFILTRLFLPSQKLNPGTLPS